MSRLRATTSDFGPAFNTSAVPWLSCTTTYLPTSDGLAGLAALSLPEQQRAVRRPHHVAALHDEPRSLGRVGLVEMVGEPERADGLGPEVRLGPPDRPEREQFTLTGR